MFLTKVKKKNQATSKENTTPPEVSEEEEMPELLSGCAIHQCHHDYPHRMVQQISSSFIIGEYNKVKMFLIYHYCVHIMLHYYFFYFIISTYYYIITVLMSKTVFRMSLGSMF